jgi:hypothetical protein
MTKLPRPVLLNVPALLNTPETPLLCATIETLVACAGLAVNTPVALLSKIVPLEKRMLPDESVTVPLFSKVRDR